MRHLSSIRRTAAVSVCALLALAPLAAQSPSSSKSFLWRVDGGKTPLYLLGSIHLLSSAYYPLPAQIDQAFESSGTLVEEVDLDELTSPAAMSLIMSKAMLKDGKTLEQALTPATYARLIKYLEASGMPVEPMKRFKPWMISMTLTALAATKAGFDVNLGIDKHFFDKAKKAGKPVQGLETAAYQIERLDEMMPEDQDDMVKQTLNELENERNNLTKMADAWATGDAPALEKLLMDGFKESPRAYERLLAERNRNWMPALEKCLDAARPCFVVVGAAHLIGPDGLVTMLKKKGLKVEQK